jgi:hypothetical protein
VGSKDKITVEQIAKIVARETGHPKIRLRFTGGVDGGRGWKGDVKNMQLSIQKLLGTRVETEVFEQASGEARGPGARAAVLRKLSLRDEIERT